VAGIDHFTFESHHLRRNLREQQERFAELDVIADRLIAAAKRLVAG
jgi:hypothetical protein